MLFSKKEQNNIDISLDGKHLAWVKTVKYLGNYLDCDMSEKTDVRMKRSDLVYRVNHTISTLGKCRKEVTVNVFNTKCCHFYGAQAWNLCDSNIVQFQTMWNRCTRRILEVPSTTHRNLLPGLVGRLSALEQIYCRFIKMVQTMLKSANVKVKFIYEKALLDVNSIIFFKFDNDLKRYWMQY